MSTAALSTKPGVPTAYRSLAGSLRRSLLAENKSLKTVKTYCEAVVPWGQFLTEGGMPAMAAHVRREHVESFVADQLERWKPYTALNRYRALTPLPSTNYSGLRNSWPFGQTWGVKAYSKDLRIRVLDAVDRGLACRGRRAVPGVAAHDQTLAPAAAGAGSPGRLAASGPAGAQAGPAPGGLAAPARGAARRHPGGALRPLGRGPRRAGLDRDDEPGDHLALRLDAKKSR